MVKNLKGPLNCGPFFVQTTFENLTFDTLECRAMRSGPRDRYGNGPVRQRLVLRAGQRHFPLTATYQDHWLHRRPRGSHLFQSFRLFAMSSSASTFASRPRMGGITEPVNASSENSNVFARCSSKSSSAAMAAVN